jgi:hypothetical protein
MENNRECAKEIDILLKKYNCNLQVRFTQEVVLGNPVLQYSISVEQNPEQIKEKDLK